MKKLPVTGAMSHALSSTRNFIGFAFYISWPWILMLLPLNVAVNLYLVNHNLTDPTKYNGTASALTFILSAANILVYSSIAVNWHRFVLLDDVPVGLQRLRLDGLTLRYFFNVIGIMFMVGLLAAICMVPVGILLAMFGGTLHGLPAFLFGLAILPIVGFLLVSFYRLSVKLPAVALGRTDFTFGNAWRATSDNFWQFLGLFLLFLICTVIVLLALLMAAFIFRSFGLAGLSISLAMQVMVNWLMTILGVTLLTSLYGFFVEGRDF